MIVIDLKSPSKLRRGDIIIENQSKLTLNPEVVILL